MSVDINLAEIFDNYVLKFLDNFPQLDIKRNSISESELMVNVKVKDGNKEEYFIHVKKV